MNRISRLVVIVAALLCTAALIALHHPAQVDRASSLSGAAQRAVDEPTPLPAPRQSRGDADVVANSSSVSAVITTPAAPADDSPAVATDSGAVHEVDESSEQFRHSRRGDGQHAE
jgi:hypothetical protein